MYRPRLTTLALLVPLSLNGMWIVCADSPMPEVAAATATHEASADCEKMCPFRPHQAATASLDSPEGSNSTRPGEICFLPADGDGNWNAVAAVAAAMPPTVIRVHADLAVTGASHDQPVMYIDPSLAGSTPPPKA